MTNKLYHYTHDVRRDYDKYYKTVIPNLIGNLPYKKGDPRSLINRILSVILDLIGENDTKTSILHFVIPACEPESPWNLFANIS